MHYLYLSQYSSMIEFVNEYMHIEQIFYLVECIINGSILSQISAIC